ncbi:MAG: glycerol dehydrogenase, partial [Chloroflexota bacterium]
MTSSYKPGAIFSTDNYIPRVMIAPSRYIQGPDALEHLGRYLSLIPAKKVGLLITEGGQQRFGTRINQTLRAADIEPTVEIFQDECSYEEAERAATTLRQKKQGLDCLIAVGGGKCLDAGKAVAFRLGVPVVTCPTLASTDAPCSAVAVMYTPEGIALGGEFYPQSPALVVVDSQIIAQAPARFLVAGMADALATWYEAKACFDTPTARSMVGGRIPVSVLAMAETGANLLFEQGPKALSAVHQGRVTEALEQVIEINTLTSGLGFESGGLAVVHAVAKGLTAIESVRLNYLHGELVAIGILTQLILTRDFTEAERVVEFFAKVGLPHRLEQIGIHVEGDREALYLV